MYYNGRRYTRSDLTEAWYDSDNMRVPLGLQHTLETLHKKELIEEKERNSLMLPGAEEPGASIKRIAKDNPNNKLNITSKDGRVQFGRYPQGANGEIQPITWRVINEDDEKMLLISELCLDSVPMMKESKEKSDNTWYSSYLRAWLNTRFLNEAFSDDERELIKLRKPSEETIADAVSLLSEKDIDYYFLHNPGYILKSEPTPYGRKKGVGVKEVVQSAYWWERNKTSPDDNNAYWWTRDCGDETVLSINPSGSKCKLSHTQGADQSNSNGSIKVGVRPVIIIRKNIECRSDDVESFIFLKYSAKDKALEKEILYIYKGNIRCRRNGHNIIQATAVMRGKSDNEIKMNVEYCTQCKKLILNYTSYEEYRSKYGVIIGNLRMVTNDLFDGAYDLAEESPLKLSGYNVGQQDDLDSQTRHLVLATIIYNNTMTKGEVIQYLEFFLRQNENRATHRLACKKWREDLEFVQNYNINTQPRVAVSGVKHYSSKRYH